jgi:mannose-1-phosphate guanylyltransferase
VPKQYCSLRGGPSLLHEALQRAHSVADRSRICTIVASQHQQWWESALWSMPRSNLIVQPENRGTGVGVLLPLLHILERDPQAHVVLLPSDHHVRDEHVLSRSLQRAVEQLRTRRREIVLLGLEPEDADPELGYIEPGDEDGLGARRVRRFVEKPSAAAARELIAAGALWNVFILAARAQSLLELFVMRHTDTVAALTDVVVYDAEHPSMPKAAQRVYRTLPQIDFSRHVLQGWESALRVLKTPACGWSDLGTPERVGRTLLRVQAREAYTPQARGDLAGHLSLATQHLLQQSARVGSHAARP